MGREQRDTAFVGLCSDLASGIWHLLYGYVIDVPTCAAGAFKPSGMSRQGEAISRIKTI